MIARVTLSAFIRDNNEQLLQEWESFARTLLPPGKTLDRPGLRDDAENLLRSIAQDMERPREPAQPLHHPSDRHIEDRPSDAPAHTHAYDRFAVGFDLDQLVAEYRALRVSVLRLWAERTPHADQLTLRELNRFHEAIDAALAESVGRYSAIMQRSKDLFLAVLGHDLRSPLGAVMAAAGALLQSEEGSNGSAKAAALILRSTTRMGHMVSDLIDFARTRLGTGLPLVRVRTNLGIVLQRAIEETEATHPTRTIRAEAKGNLQGSWDESRIKQVLSNLIENAIYHGNAESAVTVSLRGDDRQVVLTVHNEGAPIPERERERIFEPLITAPETSSPLTSKHLGLGLYIARQIVRAHGGTIEVQSEASSGTTFTVKLPRE
jgi:signal transduction histidine kinase